MPDKWLKLLIHLKIKKLRGYIIDKGVCYIMNSINRVVSHNLSEYKSFIYMTSPLWLITIEDLEVCLMSFRR